MYQFLKLGFVPEALVKCGWGKGEEMLLLIQLSEKFLMVWPDIAENVGNFHVIHYEKS